MHHTKLPSLERLDELFEADFERGQVYWRWPREGKCVGAPAGSVNSRGYRKLRVDGKTYSVHRILYAMQHRKDPEDMEIDHRNGVFDANMGGNLREATRSVNCANRKSWRNGLRGAYRRGNSWIAIIQIENNRRYLGSFATEEAAHEAFKMAALNHYGETARLD